MLLVAQRVRGPSQASGINVSAYVHGPQTSAALARDPQLGLVDPVFKPTLMLTMNEVQELGARVVSLLDVVFPDDLPANVALVLVDRALLAWREGGSPPIWSEGPVAVRFFASPETESASGELRDLRAAMMPLFGQVVSRLRGGPPVTVRPPQPVRIQRLHGRQGDRYVLDSGDRALLSKLLAKPAPASFSIADDTREAFQQFALIPLERVIVEALTGVPLETLGAFGGAVIYDNETGNILWRGATQEPKTPSSRPR